MEYSQLKEGMKIEMYVLVNKHTISESLRWVPGIVKKGTLFFEWICLFDAGYNLDDKKSEAILEHQMHNIRMV